MVDSVWERLIGEEPFLVAEIGKNFIQTKEERPPEEYLKNAIELIEAAAAAGADAVKFQTHNVEDEQSPLRVISPHFKGMDRYNWVKRNTEATSLEFWEEVKKQSERRGLIFFSTPMSRGAARKLAPLEMPLWKVGSGDIMDFVLLDYLRMRQEPIIISSGMSTLEELDKAVAFIKKKNPRLALLHCVSKYPCRPEDLNILTMQRLASRYGLPTGFSDHSIGGEGALVAVSLGAKVIEKHFSLSRDFWGSDHKVSMLSEEFREMARRIKNKDWMVKEAEKYIGRDGADELPDAESGFRGLFRKSLVYTRDLPAGHIIQSDDLMAMRPQGYLGGVPSEKYAEEIGARLVAPVLAGALVNEQILAWTMKQESGLVEKA